MDPLIEQVANKVKERLLKSGLKFEGAAATSGATTQPKSFQAKKPILRQSMEPKNKDNLNKSSEEALNQAIDKKYGEDAKYKAYEKLPAIGISFCGTNIALRANGMKDSIIRVSGKRRNWERKKNNESSQKSFAKKKKTSSGFETDFVFSKPLTFYKDIKAVEPGTVIKISHKDLIQKMSIS